MRSIQESDKSGRSFRDSIPLEGVRRRKRECSGSRHSMRKGLSLTFVSNLFPCRISLLRFDRADSANSPVPRSLASLGIIFSQRLAFTSFHKSRLQIKKRPARASPVYPSSLESVAARLSPVRGPVALRPTLTGGLPFQPAIRLFCQRNRTEYNLPHKTRKCKFE